jgi:ribulose-phosphate 3-epimerase
MTEIIPAILTDSEEELVRLVHIFERAGVTRAHLDICDGQFVPTRTVNGYDQLRRLSSKIKWDVHLMVQDPEHHIDHWWKSGLADRFIVHVEATEMMPTLADHCHGHGNQFWAAINPDTPLGKLTGQECAIDGATFMTVVPGAQGRPFRADVLEKIKLFKAERPEVPVMVDGGITPDTASQCAAAGASILVSGSFVIKSPDTAAALEELRTSVMLQ